MTARRTNVSMTKSPAFTGGEDRPAPACAGNWLPFDALIEATKPASCRYAVREAVAMCAGCPLRSTCLTENADEDWAVAVVDGLRALRRAEANDAA